MGSAPGAARLLPIHALRAGVPVGASGTGSDPDAAGRRIFPPARTEAAERFTILLRRHSLAGICSGGDLAGPACPDSAVPGWSRPGAKFHSGVCLLGAEERPLKG